MTSPEMVALFLGEARARLVHHQEARFADGGARKLHHASVERVEVASERPGAMAQADEIERPVDQLFARRPVGWDVVEHGGDVFGGSEVLDHLLVLERAADAEGGALVRLDAGEVLSVDLRGARRGPRRSRRAR